MTAVGTRLSCEICGASAIVTIAGDGTVTCSGKAMAPNAPPGASPPPAAAPTGPRIGKRYKCATCPQVVLCTRSGPDMFACHAESMAALPPQQLPAGD